VNKLADGYQRYKQRKQRKQRFLKWSERDAEAVRRISKQFFIAEERGSRFEILPGGKRA